MAEAVVARRLAACVQITPIRSVFRWKGKTQTAGEYLLSAKTRPALARRLMNYLRETHPYELPEIVSADLAAASQAYRAWVFSETA